MSQCLELYYGILLSFICRLVKALISGGWRVVLSLGLRQQSKYYALNPYIGVPE